MSANGIEIQTVIPKYKNDLPRPPKKAVLYSERLNHNEKLSKVNLPFPSRNAILKEFKLTKM